jgi:hypothetical protein
MSDNTGAATCEPVRSPLARHPHIELLSLHSPASKSDFQPGTALQKYPNPTPKPAIPQLDLASPLGVVRQVIM